MTRGGAFDVSRSHPGTTSSDGLPQRLSVEWGIVLAWCVVVALTAARHEMWRDEVRALSLAIEAASPADLPRLLQDEGHPALWHVLLWAAYRLTGSKLVLPALSLLFGGAAVLLLVFKSPLPRWTKGLFVFGGLPLYEYSVMARNYGISMLLLFAFAWWYPERRAHPWRLGFVLALLCNTNAHSLLLVAPLVGLWAWDVASARPILPPRELARVGVALLLVGVSAALALAVMWPTGESVASDRSQYTTARVLAAVGHSLRDPASSFQKVAPSPAGPLGVLASVVLLGAMAGLGRRPAALVSALAGWLALSVLFQVVYAGDYRHQGLFVVFLLTLYWIVQAEGGAWRLQMLERIGFHGCLTLLLVVLVATGAYKVYQDLAHQRSASRDLGRFLTRGPEHASSILIGEPDFALESVRYYADNPLYIVREHRFGPVVKFVRAAQPHLSLGDLLRTAREVQMREGKEVLIALGHLDRFDPGRLPPSGGSIAYSYGRTFTWSAVDVATWNASTVPVQRFAEDVIGDEQYVVYRLVKGRE